MPQRTYHYTAYMPMGSDRKIVHLRCDEERCSYRYISFEQVRGETHVIMAKNDHLGDVIHFGIPSLDERSIKMELALTNHDQDDDDKIEIELHPSLTVPVTGADEQQQPLTQNLGTLVQQSSLFQASTRPIPPLFEDHDHDHESE